MFHFSVMMHSFQKLVCQILAHFCSYVHLKTAIEFALSVHKYLAYIGRYSVTNFRE